MSARARPVVAIDGPAGTGKSTVARRVAAGLGFTLVDTGAIYRCAALAAVRAGLALDDTPRARQALGELAAALRISFRPGPEGQRVFLGPDEVTLELRSPAMSQAASRVSALPEVRAALLALQRGLGQDGGVVLEGRDIGTVVFPDAEVKVFLTASAEVRARRRHAELLARGLQVSLEDTLREQAERDRRDEGRAVAPLKAAADAVVIDTGPLSLDEVVARVLALAREVRR
ncbi:MAG TPA: (d)CMP kinase [Myxococcota bacterium]|nr:(d)CMP kinase [Myxococcota bacterium]HRY96132.1 (d)CMP kinase [Myxococcota bacterium]HSA23975.1 (d)CMP kinase [Myxococcota bacterium]